MKEIIFREWKNEALRCRNKKIGKIIKSYYRLYYDTTNDNVSLWSRENREDEGNNTVHEYNRICTVDNQSNLTINIPSHRIDSGIQSTLYYYTGLRLTRVAYTKRHKYVYPYTHEIIDYQPHKSISFIYVPNETVLDTYGKVIKVGSYYTETIDSEFNKKLTRLSKAFREKLNIIGNLLDLNLTAKQISDLYKSKTSNSLEVQKLKLSSKAIYDDLNTEVITPQMFKNWQYFSYLYYRKTNFINDHIIDVRSTSQKIINLNRKEIARYKNKIIKTKVEQDVSKPGT